MATPRFLGWWHVKLLADLFYQELADLVVSWNGCFTAIFDIDPN
jgi:hypothetical protein